MRPRFLDRIGCLPIACAMLLALAIGCLPPVPGPSPSPVNPTPVVPVPTSALRVLIVEETSARSTLPASQVAVMTSSALRKSIADAGGKLHVWDKDIDATREPKEWQDMLASQRTALPWLIITGKVPFAGPLPKTEAEVEPIIARAKP